MSGAGETGTGNGGSRPAPRGPGEDSRVDEIQRSAERVCALILYSDLPLIDIKLAAADVRRLVQRLLPDRAYLYDWIYAPRFRRLWSQWRGGEEWK